MASDPTRIQIRYTGRVQGVGFRATARAVAQRHPVTGWVRNEEDGTVLAEFQGEPADVDACAADLESAMRDNIESAERAEVASIGEERGFKISYS